MNDRHRTIERWKKKQAAKNKHINNDSVTTIVKAFTDLGVKLANTFTDLGVAIAGAVNIIFDEFKRLSSTIFDFANDFVNYIKEMPEDEFQKKLEELRPRLTDEQIRLLYKIRGDGNNDKPNSKA